MSPRASRSNWPLVDTIYCEARCPDEDVYYFGSDDDQYESPRERKRRYELAGQRFLGGSAPRLFSAALKGPLESSRGWKNPWASKTHSTQIARQLEPQIPCTTKAPTPVETTKRRVKHLATQTKSDRSECHLPSPQSLKTASLSSNAHAFLEDEALLAVQAWRHNIRPTEPDAVQQSTPSTTDAPSRKRKASHNWLKTIPDKRSRSERTENEASERTKTNTPALPVLSIQGVEESSLATKARLEPNTRFSPRDSTSQLISPPKQTPVAKNTARSTVPTTSKPSDERSKEQQAAATLSSPVSLRNVKQEKSTPQPSPLKFKAKVRTTSDAASSNRTAVHCTASNTVVHKPYRVPDDEDFIFDIDVALPSDSSESEDEEPSQEPVQATEAALEEVRRSTLHEELDPVIDDASDSDLTELSESPDLSDVEESAEEFEAGSVEVPDEMEVESSEGPVTTEIEMTDVAAASEPMDTTDEAQVEPSSEAEDGSEWEGVSAAEDASETRKAARSSGANEVPRAVSAPVLGEDTGILGGNESHDTSDAQVGDLPDQDAVEPEATLSAVGHVSSPVIAAELVGSEARVTVESVRQPLAGPAVPQLPEVKQESSEFSLKAMFRSLVPTNTWAQLTHLTSGPTQFAIQQAGAPATMEDYVLPSVEDVSAEEHEVTTTVLAHDSEAEEQMMTINTDDVFAEEVDDNGQHLLPEQEDVLTSQKLPTPRQRISDEDAPPTTTLEQSLTSSDGPTGENETGDTVAMADVPQEPNSLSGPATTRASSTAAGEMLHPVLTHTMPVPTKTPSPVPTRTSSPPTNANNPEPRFAFKSFAAFTTPSPERSRVKKRRTLAGSNLRHPRLKGILSTRHAGAARSISNRVSWFLPGEQDTESSHAKSKAGAPTNSHEAPSSPPPRTPLAELPTAANEKFAKHFSSVVKRTDGLRHRFQVAADTNRGVEPLGSGGPRTSSQTSSGITAKTTSTVGAAMADPVTESNDDVENQSRPREASLSVEPMDMVEDMVREMGDFWQAWDVDAELAAASKAQAEAAATESQSQSAWR